MDTFFASRTEEHFLAYTLPHFIVLAAMLLLAIAMFRFKSAIRSNARAKTFIRIALLLCLIIPEAALYAWYGAEGLWDVQYTLPLELCSISQMLAVIMLLTRSRLLYQIVFFAGIGGALQAMFTPDLVFAFPHFRFFHFFIVHIAIILAAFYMTWIEQYRPTWKSIGITMIFLNILVVIVGGIDYWLDANYMFLRHKPETASLLDVLGPYPLYLIIEELIALVIFTIMYLPFLRRKGSTAA
ncbi:TIGR02206 family membrane protein [Paenibacillus montanisoli]|uniref:TIGR02206 family membrane protein n=1 Tax=Paenibacillus montanisoli TaxID=2081970 RepID=A0A328TZ91_9BACL|nr:TIGR02206 family membrane protein [Paenibacillus montanisoli]RAP75082.1 TIGR02206 family membrane protein [Paenibacillus montanisoli]